MADDDKKQAEQKSIEEQEAQRKKAAEDAANLEDDMELENYLDTVDMVQQEQLEQEMAQPSPALPKWITECVRLFFEYESDFGKLGDSGVADTNQAVENVLGSLQVDNIIQDFEETVEGFSVALENEEKVIFNLKDNEIFTDSLGSKAYEAITAVVRAVGGDNLDISALKDKDARFSAWENAENKGLKLNGLEPDEENSFKEKQSVSQHR